MRTRWIGVVLSCALVLVTASCSSDGGSAAPAKPITKADLEKALLTEDDFPNKDFVAAPNSTGDPVGDLFKDDVCDDALAGLEPDDSVRSDFNSAGGTVTFTQEVERYAGRVPQVQAAFNTFLNECRLVRTPTREVTVGGLPLGVLSDDTQNAQVLANTNGAFTEMAIVKAYRDDLVTTLTLVGPRPLDRAVLDSAVRDAIGKLGAVAEGV